MVVVDLPSTLGGDDDQRVARVDVVQQLVDSRMDHGRLMVPAAANSRWTISSSSPRGALDLVVQHDVVELVRLRELLAREADPLADLALALARPLAQPALELRDRRGDEDRHGARHVLLHVERALRLELEDGDAPVAGDPVDLGAQRAVALARDVGDVLEEVALVDAADELGVGEEPVLAPVLLALAAQAGGRRDRDLELGHALEQGLDERALAGPRGAGDHEDGRAVSRSG